MNPGSKALAEFVAEATEILDALGKDLLVLDERRGQEADPDLVNGIFRAAHSLKGLSGLFGQERISRLAHGTEELLDRLRLGRLRLDDTALDALIEALDAFQALLAEAARGAETEPLTRRVEAMTERLAGLGSPPVSVDEDPLDRLELDPQVRSVFTEYEEHRLRENVRRGVSLWRVRAAFDLSDFDKGLADLNARLKPMGEVISTLPSARPGGAHGIAFDLIFGAQASGDELEAGLKGTPAELAPLVVRPAAGATQAAAKALARAVEPPPSSRTTLARVDEPAAPAKRGGKKKRGKAGASPDGAGGQQPLLPASETDGAEGAGADDAHVSSASSRAGRAGSSGLGDAQAPSTAAGLQRGAGDTLVPATPFGRPQGTGDAQSPTSSSARPNGSGDALVPVSPSALQSPPGASGASVAYLQSASAAQRVRAVVTETSGAGTASSARPEGDSTSLRSLTQTVRVDISKLDGLINMVGELLLIKANLQRLAESARQDGAVALSKLFGQELARETRGLERKLEALQEGLLEARMVPVGQVFDKLARLVRRITREAGKEIEFVIGGGEVELDKLIVEELSDPLMHLIRNAIDHGVEPPDTRLSAGKPRRAVVALRAEQKGNHVVIEVSDDGAGIDELRVREVALTRGLITFSQAQEMSRRELLNLIFLPGFSTARSVSELSGRGVGLDVVKNNLGNLSGIIDVWSERGKGTAFHLTLPVTLAIIRALVVGVSGRTYAVPLNSVLEILSVQPKDIRTVERREVLDLRGQTLPFMRLARMFALPERPVSRYFVVVVGLAQERLGIAVDELYGQQDIVTKPLGGRLQSVRGISGATDLGNRRTVLVLDVAALLEEGLAMERRRA
ncbi:chemotaxis protein CheA [Pyxidicoccus parkwayensis]|uniref:histidine kinase n=1 Tax=Pyxidicoccus parkwayensis TaxID=2813578 RepID=A0ABX7P3A0_9BACT|nr:chemotaxis protein CheA [Pyxidicoccus parkwaysis]QSQ24932.1 chemotaxis protein CheA [Pyxidicoccus parkwaysis]